MQNVVETRQLRCASLALWPRASAGLFLLDCLGEA
jgi:hypothetical protein